MQKTLVVMAILVPKDFAVNPLLLGNPERGT